MEEKKKVLTLLILLSGVQVMTSYFTSLELPYIVNIYFDSDSCCVCRKFLTFNAY